MLVPYEWLKEWVDFSASPQEVADRLTMAGLEIEGYANPAAGLDQVVTAKILEVEKHPHADRLSLCRVRTGTTEHSIVCGAKNMQAGDLVVLALPGASLPNGMKITESLIRKVKSGGMLCSKKELGLAEESEGILILAPETAENIPLAQALGLGGIIFSVNVTPNRGDCLSIRGLTRELAASFAKPLKNCHSREGGNPEASFPIEIKNLNPELCPRYTSLILRGVKVGPSPAKIKNRLEACGIRSINNIVDATNYILLELGHPVHAFDLKQIRDQQLVIRNATASEKIKTLDGVERTLDANDLIIADGQRPLAIAGVMGGEDSGVNESTQDLLLECAYFDPTSVRKTAKRLGLQTESSYRFERGIDPNTCWEALSQLAALIQELAGGEIVAAGLDLYPKQILPIEVPLRLKSVQRMLGIEVPANFLLKTFALLGITTNPLSSPRRRGSSPQEEEYKFNIPTYRPDLSREIDLIEEVARVYGYNRLPSSYPTLSIQELPRPQADPLLRLRQVLVDWGFSEVIHYSFTAPELLQSFGFAVEQESRLINPISEELSVLRPALLPQMAQTLRQNIFKGNKNLKFFELRRVYPVGARHAVPTQESLHLCLGLAGQRQNLYYQDKPEAVSLSDLKGYLNSLAEKFFSTSAYSLEPLSKSYYHPKRQTGLKTPLNGPKSHLRPSSGWGGELGELHPCLLQTWGLTEPLVIAEINLDLFLTESKNPVQFQELTPFPSVGRDLNLVLDERVSHATVEKLIQIHGGQWLKKIELFDLYRGKPLADGKKSLTYRLEYASEAKTLRDEEVNQARESLLEKLKQEVGASLRDG